MIKEAGENCLCSGDREPVSILGVAINAIETNIALKCLAEMIRCPATHVINHISADPVVISASNAQLKKVLNQADLNLPDGMGVVWACRLLGHGHLRQRVYGPDFMTLVFEWGRGNSIRHFLYGATPSVLDNLEKTLTSRYSGSQISGRYAPPYRPLTEQEEGDVVDLINKTQPHILWVGIGTPLQQVFADHLKSLVDVRAIITVGAAFDFLSGNKPQAPVFMRDHGLEWAFRLANEPRRLGHRYLIGIPKFVLGVLGQAVGERSRKNGS